MGRWRAPALNFLTVGISLFIAYLGAGAILLKYGPAIAPKLSNYFPVSSTIWWQGSAPHPDRDAYIAILEDSHALGMGDWNVARKERTDPYYSGDVMATPFSVVT